ncbi:MAG TPA: response regulator [Candidatus Deferrimicrobiaceae bacterium]|nr:response regulator [Candidatus Deferrimicrobiaceae bacterium]
MNIFHELGVKDVLLVEDDPWTRDSFALFFQIEGCHLQSAANANEAIQPLSGGRFDLILCEHWLPGMDGLSLLNQFGKDQPAAVKILITPYRTDQLVEDASRIGIHDVIQKPITVASLEKSLKRCIPNLRGRILVTEGTS